MQREALRQELLFTLLEEGGDSATSLARSFDETVSKREIRSLLMNLQREGLVEKVDEYGGSKWEPVNSEIENRLVDSVEQFLQNGH